MRINEFSKTYGKEKVLDFGGYDIEKGKIYAIIGANGSGKSTFAKVLSGALPADKNAKPFEDKISVGYMPQKSFGFRMSVRDNIALNCKDEGAVNEIIDSLALKNLFGKKGNKLSGGETARVALARLLVKKYDVLILDEPTAAMDMETTLLAEKRIKEYVKDHGTAVILITHSISQAKRMADYLMFFRNGFLKETGETVKVLENPSEKETADFLEFNGK